MESPFTNKASFNFATQTDIEGQIENLILSIIGKKKKKKSNK